MSRFGFGFGFGFRRLQPWCTRLQPWCMRLHPWYARLQPWCTRLQAWGAFQYGARQPIVKKARRPPSRPPRRLPTTLPPACCPPSYRPPAAPPVAGARRPGSPRTPLKVDRAQPVHHLRTDTRTDGPMQKVL